MCLVKGSYITVFFWQWYSHVRKRHVKHRKESWRTHDGVMSHVRTSRGTNMNESRYKYDRVMSYIWMRQITRMSQACHTYEWVTLHMQMRRDTHMSLLRHTYEPVKVQIDGSRQTYGWVLLLISVSHVAPMNASWQVSTSHFTLLNESRHILEFNMSRMWMTHGTHTKWGTSHLGFSHGTHI